MYLIEFEESEKDGKKMTAVRILDPGAEQGGNVIAETVYYGSPPGLYLQAGTTFTALRIPSARQE